MGTTCSRRAPITTSRGAVERYPAERRSVAKARFVTAVRRVINLLRLRRKWAAYGRVLQETPRCYLWSGLERRAGRLVRIHQAEDALLYNEQGYSSSSRLHKQVVHSYSPDKGVTSKTHRGNPKPSFNKRGKGTPPRP